MEKKTTTKNLFEDPIGFETIRVLLRNLTDTVFNVQSEVCEVKKALRADLISDNSGWLKTSEAAKYLSVSVSKLRDLIAAQQIPYSRLPGGHIRFQVNDLNKWLRANCPAPYRDRA